MDINATLFGQLITFAILVWFTMKYVWPPITKTLRERERKIAAGLEAAEQGKRELSMAEHQAANVIHEAKQQASHIIEQANLHSLQLIEEAKVSAKEEGARMLSMAQTEMSKEIAQAKAALKQHVATLVISGAEKIIQRELNPALHSELLDQLAAEI